MKVQLHLPPLRSLDLLISPGTFVHAVVTDFGQCFTLFASHFSAGMQAFIPGVLFDMNRCVPDGIWKPGRPCPHFTNSKIISAINLQTLLDEQRRVTVRTPAVTLCPTFHAHRVPCLPEILNPIRTKLPSSSLAGLSSTGFTQRCTLSHRAFYCSKGNKQEYKEMQADS